MNPQTITYQRVTHGEPDSIRHYHVTHPNDTESYSARDAREILDNAGEIRDGDTVEWIGGDLYAVNAGAQS